MSQAINYIETTAKLAQTLEQGSVTPWLAEFRKQQVAAAVEQDMPSRKVEHFKYNNLTLLSKQAYDQMPTNPANATQLPSLCNNFDADRLVIIDGQLSKEASTSALTYVTAFSDTNEQQQAFVLETLKRKNYGKNVFSLLGNGLTQNGYLVEFDERTENPLHIIYINTQASSQHVLNEQLIVRVSKLASANIVEHFVSDGEDNSVRHQSSHFVIEDGANLTHYRLHLENSSQVHFGENNVWLARDSKINSFHLALGSAIKRVDINVHHQASGSHADVNGLYLALNNEQVDFHTNIEHQVPHCTSQEVFRGLIGGSAKAVFNGRIHIFKDAQKTLAELSNKNLLLSNKAEINTKPELEIYADDVRCAHGATVAQMDNKALFYLMSRGIPKAQAELMLSFGFVNELLDNLSDQPIAEYLRPILAKLFDQAAN